MFLLSVLSTIGSQSPINTEFQQEFGRSHMGIGEPWWSCVSGVRTRVAHTWIQKALLCRCTFIQVSVGGRRRKLCFGAWRIGHPIWDASRERRGVLGSLSDLAPREGHPVFSGLPVSYWEDLFPSSWDPSASFHTCSCKILFSPCLSPFIGLETFPGESSLA